MKPHDESIARVQLCATSSSAAEQTATASPAVQPVRIQLLALCAGLAIAAFLWACGSTLYHSELHHGARSRPTIAKAWDKHQDLTRASLAAVMPATLRRPPNAPTHISLPSTAVPLPSAGYRLAEERRPFTLSPHIAQVHLRAPPGALA